MNNHQARTKLLIGASMLTAVLATGCDMRMNKGEDLAEANKNELAVIAENLTYMKDKRGFCYAVLNNHTYGFRSTFTFATVDCKQAGLGG